MDTVDFDALFSKINEEKKTGEILPIQKDFYIRAEQYLSRLGAENSTEASALQAQNFRKLLRSLKERRIQKILIYIAYNKKINAQLADEEAELYKTIKKVVEEATNGGEKSRKIKITSNTPEIIMPNGSKIGPFTQNQVIEVSNQEEFDFILKNKIGEEI
ncbi:MAG: hypothetical protein QW591_00060 [Candidatus Micrarchaeaceae archaeon]